MPVELPNAQDIAQAVETQLADEFAAQPALDVQAVANAVLAAQRAHATYVAQETKAARLVFVAAQLAADTVYNEAIQAADEVCRDAYTAARDALKARIEQAQQVMEDRIILAQNGPPPT